MAHGLLRGAPLLVAEDVGALQSKGGGGQAAQGFDGSLKLAADMGIRRGRA